MIEYSFCESAFAVAGGSWHLRPLTEVGRKLGGGADTKSLCGRKMAWDLDVTVSKFHLENNTCPHCLKEYWELTASEYPLDP